MSRPLLELRAVDKRYAATAVLRDVSLTVAPGEFVILIGGSGSGKTTLLRIVAGLESADSGSVTLRGEVVDDPARGRFIPPERRRLGMVFQDYALWPHMTAVETVEAASSGPREGRRATSHRILEQVGVGDLAARRPSQLSGGQQQRVGLARAIAAAPDLLLFDEPLSSLDVDVRDLMRTHIRSVLKARGGAALFVSHDPMDAWRLADRVAVLEHGRIMQAATPEALYAAPATARIARFTDAIGGFQVKVRRACGSLGFDWGGATQPAAALGVAEGDDGLLYIRPCGVKAGAAGEPAALVGRTFEAGSWRATWFAPRLGWTLCSLESAPPPPEAKLGLIAGHAFIYPQRRDARDH